MSVQVDITPSWQDYYSIVLLLVSICFEMNHYKRISPVCQRFRPVWFSTYFTGDFKGFLITIERLRCAMHTGYDCGNCVHCQCRQVSGISKLLSFKGWKLECEIARNTICTDSDWRMAASCCNPLRPSDAYMRQLTILILVQTISCRLVGASHCLNRWWFIINWDIGNIFQWNLNKINIFSFTLLHLKFRLQFFFLRLNILNNLI